MGLKSWAIRWIVQKKGTPIMGKILSKLSGYKTYIALGLGIVVAVVGRFWGPLVVGPIEIPAVETGEMWNIIWQALAGMFLRNGVAKSGPAKA
jgi:hypothetical protein